MASPVASHMVTSDRSGPHPAAQTTATTPLVATDAKLLIAKGPVKESERFPIVRMRPRAGRNSNFIHWLDAVDQLALAHGLQPSDLLSPPPHVMSQGTFLKAAMLSGRAHAPRKTLVRSTKTPRVGFSSDSVPSISLYLFSPPG